MEDKRNMVNNINKMIVVQGGDNACLYANRKSYINVNEWLEKIKKKQTDRRMIIAVASDEFESIKHDTDNKCIIVASDKIKAFYDYSEDERIDFLLKHYDEILYEALHLFETENNLTFGNAFDISFVNEFLLYKQLEMN